ERDVPTVPFDLFGQPSAPVVAPAIPAGGRGALRVTATLVKRGSVFERLRSSFGGGTPRALDLFVPNHRTEPLPGRTISGAIGRDIKTGAPLEARRDGPLGPGATRRYVL